MTITVKQLIEQLKTVDENAVVLLRNHGDGIYESMEEIRCGFIDINENFANQASSKKDHIIIYEDLEQNPEFLIDPLQVVSLY